MKIIPVIHHETNEATFENARICAEENAFGVFLISMSGENEDLPMLAKSIKGKYPQLKVGINLLGQTAMEALDTSLTFGLDMTWSDNPIITSYGATDEARKIAEVLDDSEHLFFNSVAFKYQKSENDPGKAASLSRGFGFIPTTSGKGTGYAADLDKISIMKAAIAEYPLAIASGLTPDNVNEYLPYIEYGLVATGISDTFRDLSQEKTRQIIERAGKQ